jgi:glycosyltransferase involved in cell wall biosynthesis
MRIAYVGLHLESKIVQGGVGRKIRTHIRLWEEAGHTVQLFLLTPEPLVVEDAAVFQFKPAFKTFQPLKRFLFELARSQQLASMIEAIRDFHPDIIYLRFGLFAYPLLRLFSIAPVVVELNTLDEPEYRYRGLFFYWLNRITRRWTLGSASGFAAVSHEVAKANQEFHKPTMVISNGVDLRKFDLLPAPQNPQPRMAFVGTFGYNWHGIDKLLVFAARYPDLQFDVVGYGPQDFSEPVPSNVALHGFLPPDEVRTVLTKADVAFGTLALHRKQMQEVPPLKVREALGYGIPVVIAYTDTDFMNTDFDFILQIPNTEDNLTTHGEQVHDFAYRMQGRRADRDSIAPRIDQQIKETQRLEFFQSLVRQNTPQIPESH